MHNPGRSRPAASPRQEQRQVRPMEDWLSPADAAAFLGIKPRQLQRREQNGYLTKRTLPRQPTESVGRVEYLREDLEALKAGKPNVHARVVPAKDADQTTTNRRSTALAVSAPGLHNAPPEVSVFWRSFYEAATAMPPAPRPWLTLDEAVEYSGLSRRWLLKEAEAGQGAIEIRDMGKHARGGRWRFLRDDLGKGTAS